ncbi:MAG: large conductance mechanosensitive channel protein MscL [Lachnospiraceae bacterium]|nr:large conductance mechanosensitive channel protein MscL [Lachnospiraceae bacterium]
MKEFWKEFKTFISRGSVMDMAVGIIIGGAFTAIVNSLVNDLVMPLLSILTGGFDFTKLSVVLGSGDGAATLNYGMFISAVINFLLIALVIFCLIKGINKMKDKIAKKEEESPTTKKCPFCQSEIDINATRCPHCTSQLDKE